MNLLRYAGFRSGIAVCCLLLSSLLACSPTTPGNASVPQIAYVGELGVRDGGLLSGEPCGPPCFWGIVPGETTEAEAIQILKTVLGGVSQKCTAYNDEPIGGRGLSCPNLGIGFRQGTDIVDGVGFRPSDKITLEDVIAKQGEPDALYVTADGIPEYPKTVMILYYDEIKARLDLPVQEGMWFRVQASTEIEHINYYDAATYDSLRDSLPSWDGYGVYERNCPGC